MERNTTRKALGPNARGHEATAKSIRSALTLWLGDRTILPAAHL